MQTVRTRKTRGHRLHLARSGPGAAGGLEARRRPRTKSKSVAPIRRCPRRNSRTGCPRKVRRPPDPRLRRLACVRRAPPWRRRRRGASRCPCRRPPLTALPPPGACRIPRTRASRGIRRQRAMWRADSGSRVVGGRTRRRRQRRWRYANSTAECAEAGASWPTDVTRCLDRSRATARRPRSTPRPLCGVGWSTHRRPAAHRRTPALAPWKAS